ncbi:nudix hydrolase 8-like isoform X1 [Syzygium oleosum]|uniref:nudix hydrolase 8-like isoform X1 n=1 Tax=Syzygium oleosum TaxID=219896 RepID=UPI0011D1869B|nr:nudix hydrolase 8-like isoform X1 [Syzygium oleosum]
MELKLLDAKSLFASQASHMGKRLCSRSFSNLQASCCGGALVKASYSRSSRDTHLSVRAVGSVAQDKLSTETYSIHINGLKPANSSPYSCELRVLDAYDDEYGGALVDPEKLPAEANLFASMLRLSLSRWKIEGKKGIWLKLPSELSEFVPIAVKEGFQYHHAERGYVMLTYWIPDEPCMLPANASHQVGVGGFVVNDKNEVLVVQEKYCPPTCLGLWKLPTGFILESEEIFAGAVREVKEETGIDTEFMEVIAFRHVHNVAFQKSDLFFICMLKPLSTQIVVDNFEIEAAKWMPLEEFLEQPLIQGDSMFKKIIDICIARLGQSYCGLSAYQVISKFDGKQSSLYYNVVDSRDSNCQAS